ncbi:hypothetical protein ABMA57_08365 [Saccharospirillum sp. HFRX-1]|uniref:hypothetical protein n=1 Tax=unclassified Saccharospirillum TaxID=2633430 RepID=UPI003718EA78
MTTTTFKDGVRETTYYSKYYSSVSWVIEGEVGVEVWLDHDKKVSAFYSLQQSMGWLGPSDLEAQALVTGYLVNLTDTPRRVTDFKVIYGRGISTLEAEEAEEAEEAVIALTPHTVTRVLPGTFTIMNYRTQIPVTAEFVLDGTSYSIPLSAERLTIEEVSSPRIDFPWFKPPYYPFDPPLTNSNF